jgi:hypothetical protein
MQESEIDSRIARIDELIFAGKKIVDSSPKDGPNRGLVQIQLCKGWAADVIQFFQDHFDKDIIYLRLFLDGVDSNDTLYLHPNISDVGAGVNALIKLKNYLNNPHTKQKNIKLEPIEKIQLICEKFHPVANSLKIRRERRPTLIITDEYDVQDLFRSLLKLFFEDIRPENPTPIVAGASSRIDIVLNNEKIGIEIKMTRETSESEDSRIGKEMIEDIPVYKEHTYCKRLVFFIYDPSNKLKNPAMLISDIQKESTDNFPIHVSIRP